LLRALPWSRPRTFATLYATIGAIVQTGAVTQAHMENANLLDLTQVAKRHGCAALLHDALERTPGPEAVSLRALLRRDRWSTAARTANLRDQLQNIVELLNAAGVEPILLKGAARLWNGSPQARLHDSEDLDLLFDESELDAARAALIDAGYRDDPDQDIADYCRKHHHHLAALYPQRGAFVELHRLLAPPGRISLDTRIAALRAYAVEASAGQARVYVLNRTATALHLAVHMLETLKLRDLFLLAEKLVQMSEGERRALRSIVNTERLEPIRLQAVVYAAATAAGLQWPASAPARRFARWILQRGDLPRPLRGVRQACVNAWLGADGRHLHAAMRAAFQYWGSGPRRYLRPYARLLFGLAIALYLPFMKKSQGEELLEHSIDVAGDNRPVDAGMPNELVDDRADGVRSVT
jgi:Uncharacterised nucleotidyltransferase